MDIYRVPKIGFVLDWLKRHIFSIALIIYFKPMTETGLYENMSLDKWNHQDAT